MAEARTPQRKRPRTDPEPPTTRSPPAREKKRTGAGLPLHDRRPKKAPRPLAETTPTKAPREGARGRDLRAAFDEEAAVPRALHALIDYQRRGESAVAPEKQAVFDFIVATCDVPADFEANHKYGPKSGACHEERVISAYAFEQFACKDARSEACRAKLRKLITARRWAKAAAFVAEHHPEAADDA
mmetsp:Transcript_12461/g.50112  ORF Transcript_12461/g.50112 Transcript_12461/m.50112 type:complete len:186 (-) Transcript_12461:533-1090(-)